MKKRLLLIGLLLIILAGFFVYRVKIKNRWLDLHKPSLPKEVSYQDVVATQNLGSLPENQPTNPNQQSPAYLHPKALAKEGNLAVPFTSQAPHSDWSELFKEACEEAIERELGEIADEKLKDGVKERLSRVEAGERDIYY